MKLAPHLPLEIADSLNKYFSFPEKLIFGSVATLQNGRPHLRTMRIYELTEQGFPVLLTHTRSNKWKEFVSHPQISIIIVSESKLQQIIVSGHLILDKPENVTHYWNMVRSDVKKIYDPSYKIEEDYIENQELAIPQEAPNTFGIARLVPDFWEVLLLESDYVKSYRYQFHLKDSHWQKQRIFVG